MDLQDRLSEYIKFKSLTFRDFERICGLSNGTAARLRETTRKTTLDRIANSCDLNINWLVTGEGEMIKKEVPRKEVEELTEEEMAELKKAMAEGRVTYVPLIPASAFAGSISGYAPDATLMKNCKRIVSPVFGAELAIPITGDSMEPDYPDGAIAYIKRINDDAFIPWGHTVILDTENGAFIKRIYPDDENEKYVWAKSINPAYPPLHIPTASIYRMFRVLGTSRIFTTM